MNQVRSPNLDKSASRPGDAMMARAYGPGGVVAGMPEVNANGSVNIHLTGGLEKAPARISLDGLFRDVTVKRGGQMPGLS